MRAKEVQIVFEDDEGKTYVQTWDGKMAEHAGYLIEGAWRGYGTYHFGQTPLIVGPVLRRVTEVRGFPDRNFPGYLHLETSGKDLMEINAVAIDEVIPEECWGPSLQDQPDYVFRFDVTAVRVPDPERDARELCGLPEKKP